MGGSQVYLDPRERFTVDELLYALMVQSANDAAMALALHVAGTREGFVRMMNDKAKELGLSPVTQFHSPHGLPPGKDQRPDMTTPRDFAKLCRALLQAHPEALKYTSVTFRVFRQNPLFEMRTHNHLLGAVPGCDGLKTGYFTDAGYSIAATAQRDGARVIAVVMGSVDRKVRDAKATELLARGLLDASRAPGVPAGAGAAARLGRRRAGRGVGATTRRRARTCRKPPPKKRTRAKRRRLARRISAASCWARFSRRSWAWRSSAACC